MSVFAKLDLPWDPATASRAFLETVKLRTARQKGLGHLSQLRRRPNRQPEPDSAEFVSALAAGTSSRCIVEIGSTYPITTLALAMAAKQTGGRLISFLPGDKGLTVETRQRMAKAWGLGDFVQFESNLDRLIEYKDVQFMVIDCDEVDECMECLDSLKLDERGALVVVDNLFDRDPSLVACGNLLEKSFKARSTVLPIGNGLEVVWIGLKKEEGLQTADVEMT